MSFHKKIKTYLVDSIVTPDSMIYKHIIPYNGRKIECFSSVNFDEIRKEIVEHVSVVVSNKRTPTWEEMCFVKDIFWDDTDEVIQIHPKKSEYCNLHTTCLHLWRFLK